LFYTLWAVLAVPVGLRLPEKKSLASFSLVLILVVYVFQLSLKILVFPVSVRP